MLNSTTADHHPAQMPFVRGCAMAARKDASPAFTSFTSHSIRGGDTSANAQVWRLHSPVHSAQTVHSNPSATIALQRFHGHLSCL
jgi:hypothetical protein